MFDFGALIIPSDIVAAIDQSTAHDGWLSGAVLDSEPVFVVTSATIGEATKVSSRFVEIITHRAFHPDTGTPKDQLFRWVKVEPGFLTAYPAFREFDIQELATKFSTSPDELAGEVNRYVCVIEPGEKGPKVRSFSTHSNDAKTRLFRMDTIVTTGTANRYPRIPEELTKPLGKKRVAIVGVGSGGGEIALNLACAGVNALNFFDDDRLNEENYIRHVLSRRDLGRNKILGVRDDIHDRNLPTTVDCENLDVIWYADTFRDKLSEQIPDLLICATDSRDSRRFLNICAIALNIPLVIAGILNAGRVGEVFLVSPNETACYECIRLELGTALDASGSAQRPNTPYSGGEPPDLQSAVQRFDINFVASLATRVALQVLDPERYPQMPTNYLVWGREKDDQHSSPFTFDYPLSVNFARMPRRSDCPICGTLPADLNEINIDERFEEILAAVDRF